MGLPELCGAGYPLTTCVCVLALQPLPAVALLLLAALRTCKLLCGESPVRASQHPKLRPRAAFLWGAALVSAALLAVGSVATLLVGTLLTPHVHEGWLLSPLLQGLAAIVCVLLIARRRPEHEQRQRLTVPAKQTSARAKRSLAGRGELEKKA